MRNHLLAPNHPGRRTRLALALGLTLGMSASAALAMQPQSIAANGELITNKPVLTSSMVSGEPPHPRAAGPHRVGASSSASTAATITVSNCNDSGTGSLRWAIGGASDGDTIDMSGQTSCTLDLNNSIVTSIDNLTIQGVPGNKYPILDGQNTVVPLKHFGDGTLSLSDVTIRNGFFTTATSATRGGCLFSSGNIALSHSDVKYCKAENTAAGTAEGGAVSALGNVTLNDSTVLGGTARNSAGGAAQGGGIWSQGSITLDTESTVASSKALTDGSGSARGGGTWSGSGTTIKNLSIVDNNTAQAYANGSALGGGVYATGKLTMGTSSVISNNTATSTSGFASGGGAQTGADATVKYSQIEDNLVHSDTSSAQAGGLRTDNTLFTKYTTFSGNEATSDSSAGVGGAAIGRGNASVLFTTISGNSARTVGGLALIGTSATQNLMVDQSTISGNTATNSNYGAGLYVGHDTDIRNSTITGNVESNSTDTKYGAGLSVKHDVNVDLSSTLISKNLFKKADSSTIDSDINAANGGSNASLSGDHNLIGISFITLPGDTITSTSQQLNPLADNGGLTHTHALLPGSDAIDSGSANSFTTDQRGPGFRRVAGSAADIGAFEMGGDIIFADGFESP